MKGIIVYPANISDRSDSAPSVSKLGDRHRTPIAPLPQASYAPDLDDPLVAALGDQLVAVWFAENASKLRLPLLTSRSEPGNTPAPKGGTRETRI